MRNEFDFRILEGWVVRVSDDGAPTFERKARCRQCEQVGTSGQRGAGKFDRGLTSLPVHAPCASSVTRTHLTAVVVEVKGGPAPPVNQRIHTLAAFLGREGAAAFREDPVGLNLEDGHTRGVANSFSDNLHGGRPGSEYCDRFSRHVNAFRPGRRVTQDPFVVVVDPSERRNQGNVEEADSANNRVKGAVVQSTCRRDRPVLGGVRPHRALNLLLQAHVTIKIPLASHHREVGENLVPVSMGSSPVPPFEGERVDM